MPQVELVRGSRTDLRVWYGWYSPLKGAWGEGLW